MVIICKITAFIGIIIFLAATAMFFVFPELVAKKVEKNLAMRQGAPVLAKWSKVSVPIYFKIYIFDVLNGADFVSGKAAPILREKGPYTFRETREKVISSFSNDSTIINYNDIKRFYFEPDLSVGSLDDTVHVINVPVMGIIEKLSARSEKIPVAAQVITGMVNRVFQSAGETLIMKRKVRELLFEGYHVKFFEEIGDFVQRFGMTFQSPLPNNRFGAFYNKNGTSPGLYSINAGINSILDVGQIHQFKNRARVPHWSGDSCNQINGTDGSAFHPRVKKHETLYLFNVDTCRSLYLEFEKESSVRGIPTYKFSVPDKFFKAPANEPENACFCTNADGFSSPLCNTDGILDISRCKKGAPIVLSAPHFFKGDYRLLENVDGLDPQKNKHETFLEIEPLTGLVLNAARRIQINVNVRNNADFEVVSNVNDVIMPLLWVEELATADESAADRFKAAILNKLVIGNAFIICLMVVGLVVTLVCCGYLRVRNRREKEKNSETLHAMKNSYSNLPTKEAALS